MKSIAGIRQKKKYFWDLNKNDHLFWLGVNMSSEAFLGFTAFNTKKITGKDTIDFLKYRRMIAAGHPINEELFEAVLGTPQQK
jgi:6-oxo-cyclohex-1-ene-carbonyl-CoA hydrolase